jgi:aldehyde dehydrogenase (NAD+)
MNARDAMLLIDGRLRKASSGIEFDNINPFTECVIGTAPDASCEDVQDAIGAARRAFDTGAEWRGDPAARAGWLRQLAAAFAAHAREFYDIVLAEVGCPISITTAVQVDAPIAELAAWADRVERFAYSSSLPSTRRAGGSARELVWEPAGVVSAITPFNFPLQQFVLKVAPALGAGNAVVLKASPLTPWTANLAARLVAEETDIPPGVLNILTAKGDAPGKIMVSDPRVDMVSFTGSTKIGAAIGQAAAATIKNVVLELGGKSPCIVLEDADFEKIVTAVVRRAGTHAGQSCSTQTRLLAPRARYAEAVEIAAAAAPKVPIGDPAQTATLVGPLIDGASRARVLEHIERARAEGGRVVAGGGMPRQLPKGYFVDLTVVVDVDPDSALAQQEVFGPVLAMIPYDTEQQAVEIANNSPFGLSGAVWSSSSERALAIARRVRSGLMDVNGASTFGLDAPRGGFKQSGVGREYGDVGFQSYLEARIISWPAAA